MATITATLLPASGQVALTETVLDGVSDTFAFGNRKQFLILRNPTAGAISPVIDGDAGTTIQTEEAGQVDVSAGYAVGSIAAGAAVIIKLSTVKAYLQGTITITGGTGLVAALIDRI